jgi:hypothetical protein
MRCDSQSASGYSKNRFTYGYDWDQKLDDYRKECSGHPDFKDFNIEKMCSCEANIPKCQCGARVTKHGSDKFVLDRFQPVVKKGDLISKNQRAQSKQQYVCLSNENSFSIFESTSSDALFTTGLYII